ncbi:MAG: glycine cleavage system protein GcvH [Candidatus Sumerlaeia bacterium]
MGVIEGYTKTHEWVMVDDDVATVGITEFAQEQLSDVVFVELPAVGEEAAKGEEIAVVESTKIAASVYAPVSGEVVEVNTRLEDEPELINNSPTEEGWVVKIKIASMDELEDLMSEGEYQEFIAAQEH